MNYIVGYIFCAGYGTRLRPRTYDVPKCLLPIDGDRTFLDANLEWMRGIGISRIFINATYRLELFEQLLEKYPDLDVTLIKEKEPLGHGTSIMKLVNLDLDADAVFGVNGDTVTRFDIKPHLEEWGESEYVRVFGSSQADSPRNLMLHDSRIIGYESPTKTVMYEPKLEENGRFNSLGIYLFNPLIKDLKIKFDPTEFVGLFGTDDLMERIGAAGGIIERRDISQLDYYASINTEEEYQNLLVEFKNDK